MDDIPNPLLRGALELSHAEAKRGLAERPPLEVPAGMRPFVRFAKFPSRALEAVRKAVEADDAFRERVALKADAQTVGRAGWLWLTRPAGWESDLETMASEHRAQARSKDEEQAEASARRRAKALSETVDKLNRRITELEDERTRSEQELSDLRRWRTSRLSEEDAAATAYELRSKQLESAQREISRMSRRLAQSAWSEAGGKDEQLLLQAELAATRAKLEQAERRSNLAEHARQVHEERTRSLSRSAESEVARAAAGAREMAAALSEVARLLGAAGSTGPHQASTPHDAAAESQHPGDRDPSAPANSYSNPVPASSRSNPVPGSTRSKPAGQWEAGSPGGLVEHRTATPPSPRGPRSKRRRHRHPGWPGLPLPGGLFTDSPEAARWLVRQPGMLLLVDGYNICLTSWPSTPLGDQRGRLARGLDELSLRTGVEVEVVFDGVEADPMHVRRSRGVTKVRFTPADLEADDAIISRVRELGGRRPVTVASNDKRVREGSSQGGANLLTCDQLLGLIGGRQEPR